MVMVARSTLVWWCVRGRQGRSARRIAGYVVAALGFWNVSSSIAVRPATVALPARRETRTLDLDPTVHAVGRDSRDECLFMVVIIRNVCSSVLSVRCGRGALERITLLLSGFSLFIFGSILNGPGTGSLSFARFCVVRTCHFGRGFWLQPTLVTATAKEVQ